MQKLLKHLAPNGQSLKRKKPSTANAPKGHANVISILLLIGLIIASIWTWNHLSFDTQDYITDEIIPILFVIILSTLAIWLSIRKFRNRRYLVRKQQQLIEQFTQERSPQKRFDQAVTLIELNGYELQGLETIKDALAESCIVTYKMAIGDKQHRIRGMAISHLGALQDQKSVPLLIRALEDDHAYVRGCAALALGRMRAQEAKEKLQEMMKEDWDQTVRSRSREAIERMS
ncbi:MAG: hypothetical protein GKS05_02160 [Nitrospirales bacterium]|nr:hypothetical protein [Nitrospirales bacterium]